MENSKKVLETVCRAYKEIMSLSKEELTSEIERFSYKEITDFILKEGRDPSIKKQEKKEESLILGTLSYSEYFDMFDDIDELKKAAKVWVAEDIRRLNQAEALIVKLREDNSFSKRLSGDTLSETSSEESLSNNKEYRVEWVELDPVSRKELDYHEWFPAQSEGEALMLWEKGFAERGEVKEKSVYVTGLRD